MPAFAPRRSILAEKERAQAARDERDGMRITLGGRSYPQAEVFLGGIKIESHADGSGFRLAQRIVVKIRKALLKAAPPRDTLLTITPAGSTTGIDFTVLETTGQSTSEIAHVIEAIRLPPAP
jgi:hypothetical protein